MFRPNRLKKRLAAGAPSVGCWLFMGSPAAAEIVGQCGYDAVIVDHEHSPGSLETAIDQLRAIALSKATGLVRIADAASTNVKRVLDSGAEGIVLANLESAEQAEQLVAASYYPPFGRRGAHYTVSRASGWGTQTEDYRSAIADNLLIVGMIESASAVSAIPELERVERLDMLFIGPLDLSASIGLPGRYEDPAVRELMFEAERRTIEAGLKLGGTTLPGHEAGTLFGRGYDFVTVASDVGLIRDGASAAILAARSQTEKSGRNPASIAACA